MNRFAKFTLVLGAAVLMYLPTQIQAIEPAFNRNYSHHNYVRQGLRITLVTARSPAAMARLECGDVIVAVDGRAMCNPDDLHRALHATGYRGMLTVRDARTGHIHHVRVYPDRGHIGVNVVPVAY
ncbi:MAG TPA: PDZ domain-containing protein [Gemmatales bacterium]|nr:PDZ domain-containing protein [Gemmatales bacterium]